MKRRAAEIINVQNLTKAYNKQIVLKQINLNVKPGEIYGLIGVSGSGKSTLLRCINGIEKFHSGTVHIDNEEISCDNSIASRRIKKKIGMIFQNFALLKRRTVYENIALPMKCWKEDRKKTEKRVRELMEFVGISHLADKRPSQISGGQKQRVAIARALSLSPKILLCDEATSALDPNTTKSILELLKEINRKMNITIIVVTHEMEVIKSVCDKMSIIENGEIKVSGDTQDIFLENPKPLQNLIGRKEILPLKENTVLKISFVSGEDTAVLSCISRDLKMEFSILSADIDDYNDKTTGNIFISFKSENRELVKNYLIEKKVIFNEYFDIKGGES
jgi:D-methionine transport system ATP-binding protein